MKTTIQKGVFLAFLIIHILSGKFYSQSNFVPKDDPRLQTTKKYDNPMRGCYNLSAVVGVDASKDASSVYADISSYFTLKYFFLRANYSFDLTGSSIISTKNPLVKQGQPYSNFQISGFFNVVDNIKDLTVEPTVGVRELEREYLSSTLTKVKVNLYHTKESVKVRRSLGLGGSVIMNKLNFAYTATDSTQKSEAVQLKSTASYPTYILLPYNSLVIGAGMQYSYFTSYNIRYQYDGLIPTKFKENTSRIFQLEALFAPSIKHNSSALTSKKNVVNEIEVEKVKKFPLGVRLLLQQSTGKSKILGVFYNIEGGIRPGIYEKTFPNSLYVRFGIGLTIL